MRCPNTILGHSFLRTYNTRKHLAAAVPLGKRPSPRRSSAATGIPPRGSWRPETPPIFSPEAMRLGQLALSGTGHVMAYEGVAGAAAQ
jgi:hypothetical protein